MSVFWQLTTILYGRVFTEPTHTSFQIGTSRSLFYD